MHSRHKLGLLTSLAVGAAGTSAPAFAESAASAEPTKPLPPPAPELGLDPTAPQTASLPGGVTPAYGQRSLSEGEWRFDFHGFLTAPLVVGFGERSMPLPDQSGTTLHTPPAVPDDLETFSHTGVVPTTYVQLNFSEGNSIVTGNVSLVAKQANASTSFLEPSSQLGITDVFLAITPPTPKAHVQALL